MIGTIITKPTKVCNASCTYCSAPPDGAPKWSWEQFTFFFDRVQPHLAPRADIIWHGGEPMLMGPDFYWRAWEYAKARHPGVRFSMQTNLLGYSSARWRDLFRDVFEGNISTSFDPDESFREYRGSTKLYTRLFFSRLEAMVDDGFHPLVIGTYGEETVHYGEVMYEKALSYGDKPFSLRFNYRYPAGRARGQGELIRPATYAQMLIHLYDRWIRELPNFLITPLDQMLRKTLNKHLTQCPWTKACGGAFLGVEPNFDVYNCSEFADLGEEEWRFGNLQEQTVPELLKSRAATLIRRRRVHSPVDCQSCRHFVECEGGCMRDAVLYDHGIFGKFHYCQSWKMVFDRIKQSIRTGEADAALAKMGLIPGQVRRDLGYAA